jgi:hypothetical protein
MFIEHDPYREKKTRWQTPLMTIWGPGLLVTLLLWLGLLWWITPAEMNIPSWKREFQQAEFWRENGDPYRATFLYGEAVHMAAAAEDWEGLITIACGLKRMGRIKGGLNTAEAVLLRALHSAEQKVHVARAARRKD